MNKAFIILLFLLPASLAFPLDPFNYFVEIKNFDKKVLHEKNSRFRLASSGEDFSLLETHYQKILKRHEKEGGKIIEIQTGAIGRPSRKEAPAAEFLSNTRFLNLDSSEIVQATQNMRTSDDTIKSVEEFVYARISDKTLGIPIIPAAQIYRNRRGDCTEHSVLALAMLRKLRVPSRAVVGMYLTDNFMNKKNIFVFHMWVEAFYKKKWRLVDATMPGKKHLNRYIAFAHHNLKTEAPLPYLRAVMGIQQLTAEYIDK